MSRIMIDLDGPVVDFGTGMIRCLQEQGILTDPDDHYFGAPKDGFRDRMRRAIRVQNVFARCRSHPDAMDALWQLYEAGHELFVVSSRLYGHDTHAWSYLQTLQFLDQYGAPPMEVMLIEHGSSKVEHCEAFDLEYAIEDDLRNYRELSRAGVKCYLITRPWNVNTTLTHVHPDYRVSNWDEFVKVVGP